MDRTWSVDEDVPSFSTVSKMILPFDACEIASKTLTEALQGAHGQFPSRFRDSTERDNTDKTKIAQFLVIDADIVIIANQLGACGISKHRIDHLAPRNEPLEGVDSVE
jgi:hypothetical protein